MLVMGENIVFNRKRQYCSVYCLGMSGRSEAAIYMFGWWTLGVIARLSDETSCQKPNMHDSLLELAKRESVELRTVWLSVNTQES